MAMATTLSDKHQQSDSKPRGRPPTPCPRCGKGKREYQVLVQSRLLGGTTRGTNKESSSSSSLTVCAKCAGKLRAELTMLLQNAVSGKE